MFQATPMARGIATAFGGLACAVLIATPAYSQDSTPQKLDRVEVTGSLIKRIESETATQVVTLKVDELEKAGVTNAEQAVKYIT